MTHKAVRANDTGATVPTQLPADAVFAAIGCWGTEVQVWRAALFDSAEEAEQAFEDYAQDSADSGETDIAFVRAVAVPMVTSAEDAKATAILRSLINRGLAGERIAVHEADRRLGGTSVTYAPLLLEIGVPPELADDRHDDAAFASCIDRLHDLLVDPGRTTRKATA